MSLVLRTCLMFAFLGSLTICVGSAAEASEFEKYGLESVSAELSSTQAGVHADFTTSFELSQKAGKPYAQTKDVEVMLPAGMIGNPQAMPRCTVSQLGNLIKESACPVASQVGVTEVTLGGDIAGTFREPIYNMVPPRGDIVARLGFFAGIYPAVVNIRVNPTDYSLIATLEGASSAAGVIKASTTLWGVPAAAAHDLERITPDEALNGGSPPEGRPAGVPEAPFLTNPTNCSLLRQITMVARSYQRPDQPSTLSAPFPQITGCGNLGFDPKLAVLPANPEASAPMGLDVELAIPQNETPQGRATSTLKSAVVTLPKGLTVNPAAADGLAACGSEQVGFGTSAPPACPDAAQLGEVEIEVPALEDTLNGAIYQRTPEPGRLFRFWLVTDEQGVRLKLPAEIEADPVTGQLTTVFEGVESLGGLPQVPFSEMRLHVFGGPRAPLATPASCGTYETHFSFAPWSGKPAVEGETAMEITSGCEKDGFAPGLAAGTSNPLAGAFSPFALTLTRLDGEANPQSLFVTLPQGLLAKLGGVPLCPDEVASTGACPAASQVGSITAAAGVGGAPLWIPQPGKDTTAVYLAGPYKGAPYSILAKVPAQAGPFELGVVVNRAGIYVDPETAIATIKSDPLPQMLEGVPVLYRTVHIDVDRPEFTLNSTGCEPQEITATVTAANGAVATPSAGYQASGCPDLVYPPKLKLSFKGKTKRTGHAAVKAVLTQKPNQANTAAATVLLPKSQFIDQSHINNPCTRVQFNAGACPKGSILGTAKAVTPLLDQPLSGPVYFRSNGGERELPDIVADLRGPIHITLVGFVDSVTRKRSGTSRVRTRFLSIPDAPVSRFEMNLFGGKRGLLVNSENLCLKKQVANARFVAHNKKVKKQRVVIATGCSKNG